MDQPQYLGQDPEVLLRPLPTHTERVADGSLLLLLLLLLVVPHSELRPHLLCEAGLQRVGSEKGFVDKVGVGYCRELKETAESHWEALS